MLRACGLLIAAAGMTVVPAQAADVVSKPHAQTPAPALDDFAYRVLAAHNRERSAVGHPPLAWDPALAASAASYGPVLATLGYLVHSPRGDRPGQRENLAMAYGGTMTAEQLVGMWTDEKRLLVPGVFPNVSRTGHWKDVAHYTQMVWRTTTHVGCALHRAEWDYLICRYSPPGNVDGKPVFGWPPVASR
ncbi:MAG TPA: CAP domain-containing protein [Sphingomicrobium sp.]|jgi:hypothetical protein|nr:CAP domain-containing protein [Sphingomicrobium sp.]